MARHTTRNRLVALERWHGPDDPRTIEARRDHKEQALADHIARTVGEWPELRPEQIDRLTILLRGGAA